jgi:hypothetical protein
VSANLERVRAVLDRHRKLFDLREGDLGRKLCKAATDGVQECIADQREPDGTPWPELSTLYDEWKSFHYPGNPMAVLHGIMANPREIAGVVEVSAERAVVTLGVSDRARAESSWFQEGDPAAHRPPRRFWGFTPESQKEAKQLLDDRFKSV